jgi:hypothetical protein
MMLFSDAEAKLDKIAGDNYHAIKYEVDTFEQGRKEVTCRLYIIREGVAKSIYQGNTWEEAFQKLEGTINTTEGQPE